MSDDFARLRAVFDEAVERVPPERWGAYLDRACAGDDGLRREAARLLKAHADGENSTPAFSAAAERPSAVIGPYKLLEPIGEGGMGTVWMAQQLEPVRRRVAVKLIKAGMDSRQVVARFEAERQALALMDHPNIAKVLDGGATPGGLPYFVMELVKGVSITRYCDEARLTPRQRLELFLPVCAAVQHAHQKGVIHRDLKPSNVLVACYDGKPVPKVIDFGVAKAAGAELTDKTLFTGFGAVIGTLEYMSPEQAELNNLDIDTRSDVYALGVLLYELLTGTTPLDRKRLKATSLLEALRLIREEEPPAPSTRLCTAADLPTIATNRSVEPRGLNGLLRGELDWIVMKCLDKDRGRRYDTATALAADLGRHLNDEPVQACPPTAAYRLRKFVRRHRVPVLTGTAGLLLLIGGIVGTTVGLVQAEWARRAEVTQREAAERERDEKEQARKEAVAHFQTARQAIDQMLVRVGKNLTFTPQMEKIRRDVLRDALSFHEELLKAHRDDPTLQRETALVRGWLGTAYDQLGQNHEAESAFREAIRSLELLFAEGKLDRATRIELTGFYRHHGSVLSRLNRSAESYQARARAVDHTEELFKEDPNVLLVRDQLATSCIDLGHATRPTKPNEAERLLRRALALLGEKGNRNYQGRAHLALAEFLLTGKRWEEVDKNLDEAEKLYATLTRQAPRFWQNWERLADVYIIRGRLRLATGRPVEAVASYRQAVKVLHKLQTDYPSAAFSRSALTKVHHDVQAALKKAAKGNEEFPRLKREVEELLRSAKEVSQPDKGPQ